MGTIQKKRVSDIIIENFKTQLESGELKEGDRLPPLTQYAKALGVSRLSLREAMQTLEKMGAIHSRPKVGTVIVCGDPSRWAYPIINNMFEDEQTLGQLMEARMFFEGILAAQCAIHIHPAEIHALKEILDKQRHAFDEGDLDAFYHYDTQFHSLIASSGKNIFMQRAYTELLENTNPSFTAVLRNVPGAIQDSVYMHQKIFDAIASLDSSSAERHACMHLRRLQEYYATKQRNS